MGLEGDRLVHAGKSEVGAVEGAKAQVVVDVVIQPDEAVGPVGIGEEPALKLLFDLLLLLAGGQCLFLIEDALFLAIAHDGVIDDGSFQVKCLLKKPDPVGALGAVVGGRGN